ncbi:hypothetical protein PVL29_011828 [Vitis rotundifolia]|uniref:Uncharacterized protein n=1 Tax=Vitis rotundifolia TaxID=103349 RepID=A0AA39DQ03_VITRO|nr:hypothetical protein PVL29_011828 [Vitis rotundifolia]
MSSTKEGFSSGLEVTAAIVVEGANLDRGSEAGFGQAFSEGEGLIAMDSYKHLCYLSRNLTLKLEAISFSSSSSSQIIGGTSWPTPTFGSLLEDEEDGEDDEDEADDENREVGDSCPIGVQVDLAQIN